MTRKVMVEGKEFTIDHESMEGGALHYGFVERPGELFLATRCEPVESDRVTVAHGVEGAAKALRGMAILTANNTQNWDNYEKICHDVLEQVYSAGKLAGTAAQALRTLSAP